MLIRISLSARLFPNIYQLLTEVLSCPNCGAHQTRIVVVSESLLVKPHVRLACNKCNFQGALKKTLHDAVTSWRKPLGFFTLRLEKLKSKWGVL